MKHLFKAIIIFVLITCLAACNNADSNATSSQVITSTPSSSNITSSNTSNLSAKDNSSVQIKDKDGRYTSEYLAIHEHVWGSWQIIEGPEGDKPGISRRTCKICKITEDKECTMEDVYDFHSQFGLQYSQ